MAASNSKYDKDLGKNAANYQALTPLGFIERAANAHPDRAAWIYRDRQASYAEFYARCRRLASALEARGVGQGDTVAIMCPNTPPMLEAHYGVPMIGAVLNALNIRLDAATIAFILDHGEAKVLLTDKEFSPVIGEALKQCKSQPLVIDIDDAGVKSGETLGEIEYEDLLKEGDPEAEWTLPDDEWSAISLNYTSGTTGNPKGVVYHHRGAYLLAVGNSLAWSIPANPVYLWTLPMFHCNGWCFTWTITIHAGTHVCLRRVEPKAIYDALADEGVTHLCGAPVVLNTIANAPDGDKRAIDREIQIATAGAAPPAAVIGAMESIGFRVTHLYGLTETYGPSVVSDWHEEWNDLPEAERADKKARQGVRYQVLEGLMVADPKTLEPTPADGTTMGEVMFRGNVVMKGYLKNPKATKEAFAGGWFHSGDLGVMHPDGYIELKDRSKDIIISGGENISTIEVEGVIFRHPAVLEAAVVAAPDEKWGEVPCAFVTLRQGKEVSTEDIISYCRDNMAHFKAPKKVVFGELPKTSTGKVQKYVLRERAAEA